MPADRQILLAIFATFETFFAESGCPFTEAQVAAMESARRDVRTQVGLHAARARAG